MLSLDSPCFGKYKLKFDQKRLSKMTQDDIRSIKTINYTPISKSSKNILETKKTQNMKIISTFRQIHEEEASRLSRSQIQSTKNIVNMFGSNLANRKFDFSNHKRKVDNND
mmetsp:Transcript_23364/g.26781  ORF Transcript_23364/g.26781 Transcript_23364/m.26781 type:complete len:111 (-) Transcript_23364:446-778(-)